MKNKDKKDNYSRREFLTSAVAVGCSLTLGQTTATAFTRLSANEIRVVSPDGQIQFVLNSSDPARISFSITFKGKSVIETSLLGLVVDGIDLSRGVEIGKIDDYKLNEKYLSRGVHSEATNNCSGVRVSVAHKESKTPYVIDVRVFNNGVAFRHIVPGEGKQRVPDEATTFVIPNGSTVWYHDFEGHYEGVHVKKNIAEVKPGEWAALPLTVKLPDNSGYASITEGALINYSGMGLQAGGQRGFTTRLAHALPISYPFRLRYEADQARVSKPAVIAGTITTPWRVVMIGPDLNTLVNCDIVNSVSPPPDKKLFPQGVNTDWVKPGRAVWKYLDGGENTLDEMKNFSKLAGQLGFEYNVVEGFWQKWTEDQMRELVDYSRQQKVGIWFWKHSKDLRTPENRQTFFKLCNNVGVVGAKIDFFDHEAKEIIDLYQTLLKDAAEAKIMIDFHGANKPAGESRTWPNEMTREGVFGLEHKKMEAWSTHNTTLPFTRLLAGHADYTGMHFGDRRRETSWAHQIASVTVFTSPVLIFGAHPKNILENPAVDMIKSLPTIWDETIALPSCEIGQLAAFARRRGDQWFLAIMNGPTPKTIKIPLVFLGHGKHKSMLVRDNLEDAAAVNIEQSSAIRTDVLAINLRAGGGFIGRFQIR